MITNLALGFVLLAGLLAAPVYAHKQQRGGR